MRIVRIGLSAPAPVHAHAVSHHRSNGYPVWDYSEGNIAELARMGTRAEHCGIGYMPELKRIARAPEDIDVLFVGSVNERRIAVLKQLATQGVNVEARFNIYGAERDSFVARSKIILNVHFYESRLFEIVRVSYLLANQKCVVSETCADARFEKRFEPGIAFAPYDKLAETCVQLLQNPAARREMAGAGFERIKALPQTEYLQRVLATLRSDVLSKNRRVHEENRGQEASPATRRATPPPPSPNRPASPGPCR